MKKKSIYYLAIMFVSVISISACNRAATSDGNTTEATELFPITRYPENPSSIFLKLTEKTKGDSSYTYIAEGLYEKDTVGFLIEVNKHIPAGVNKDGSVNERDGFKKGVITFKTLGAKSDRFVAALAQLWKVGNLSKMKNSPIQPLVFTSNKKPVDLDKPFTYSFKLFFNDTSDNPGEIFFTFDTYKRGIEFQEKNAQYRTIIVQAFAE